jgi:hypothetical protein
MLECLGDRGALTRSLESSAPLIIAILDNGHDSIFNNALLLRMREIGERGDVPLRLATLDAAVYRDGHSCKIVPPRLELWAAGELVEAAEGRSGLGIKLDELSARARRLALGDDCRKSNVLSLPTPLFGFGSAVWNNKVFLTGGFDFTEQAHCLTAELTDLVLRHCAPLVVARFRHTTTLLEDKLVSVGGSSTNQHYLSQIEWLDSPSSRWRKGSGELCWARHGHCATAIDGDLFISGGFGPSSGVGPRSFVERIDRDTGRVYPVAGGGMSRLGHTAHRLSGGRLLIVGGIPIETAQSSDPRPEDEILLWRSDTGRWEKFGTLRQARAFHAAALDEQNMILVVSGGYSGNKALDSVEYIDLTSGRTASIGRMRVPRAHHSMFGLPDGNMILLGGQVGHQCLSSIESTRASPPRTPVPYDTEIIGFLSTPRHSATMVSLTPYEALLIGGIYEGNPVRSVERLDLLRLQAIAY